MKVHVLQVVVIDHDELGAESVIDVLQNARYPNRCIMPSIPASETYDIGEWTDDHPMNLTSTDPVAWLAENAKKESQ